MSATLGQQALSEYLPHAEVLTADARTFPVDIHYLPPAKQKDPWDLAVGAAKSIISGSDDGDILVFMPGVYEINRTVSALRDRGLGEPVSVLPLYGDLPADRQDAVMEPGDRRKIIVATNIAETSLTIPGVRHVIDAGLARISRYDSGRGLNMLTVEPISRSSAEQRAGRAGREAPGTCRRLWTESNHDNRAADTTPEILRVDLAEALLYLRGIGLSGFGAVDWLDSAPVDGVETAEELLRLLGAVDDGELTALGKQLNRVPAHPRIARLLVEAELRDCLPDAALIAAVLSDRGIVAGGRDAAKTFKRRFPSTHRDCALQSDCFAVLAALDHAHGCKFSPDALRRVGVHGGACRSAWRTAEHLAASFNARLTDPCDPDPAALLQCLLLAFPDHLGKRRDKNSRVCRLRGGRSGELAPASGANEAELFVAGDIREIQRRGKSNAVNISMISEIRTEWLDQFFPDAWDFADDEVWNDNKRWVEHRRTTRCLDVVLDDVRDHDVDPGRAAAILAAEIKRQNMPLGGWKKEVNEWFERCRCLAEWFPERGLITYTDDELEIVMEEFCMGTRKYSDVRNKPALPYVKNLLSWDDQQFVEKMAPTWLPLPSGRKLKIRYKAGQKPKGNARIQELYGLDESPTIADGRAKLLLEILAPNMRPVQVTEDLAGFWENLYPTVKQQLSKRYPKHEWR
jgi:ATP-dependent helicase HrpB